LGSTALASPCEPSKYLSNKIAALAESNPSPPPPTPNPSAMRSAASLLVLDSSYAYTRVALVVSSLDRAHASATSPANRSHTTCICTAPRPRPRRSFAARPGGTGIPITILSAHSSAATRNISATVALVVADPRCRIARSGLGAAPPLDTANPTRRAP
tara:strand:- start:1444 stop:1917 length:474 start_codon:yes stop_codon:yes gene_type:complete